MYISVTVIPKASAIKVVQLSENAYKVWVTVAPEKGKANKEVIKVLAEHLGIKKNQLRFHSGQSAREKILERLDI